MSDPRPAYATGSVTSKDGTTIGYRRLGDGPGLVLVHGGMQASQNLMKLAAALADAFTLYVPDRRGRGSSGPYGEHHTIQNAVDDIEALLEETGAHQVFGLSAGAVISLHAALTVPEIHELALYEPPVPINGAASSDWAWTARYEQELARGKLGAAMVTIAIGTEDSRLFRLVPRFVMEPLMTLAIKAEAKQVTGDDVPLEKLIPTMHHDVQMVLSTASTIDDYKNVTADVLLLGGGNSPAHLKLALDRLERVLPRVRRVELDGVGHLAADNRGKPERVARELRRFFSEA